MACAFDFVQLKEQGIDKLTFLIGSSGRDIRKSFITSRHHTTVVLSFGAEVGQVITKSPRESFILPGLLLAAD